jgi:hypothetical protein
MGIPYQLIGIGFGFLLGIWAFVVADTVKGRVFIAAAMLVIFFLPVVWHTSAARLVSFVGWIIYGIGCYLFLRMRGVGLK